MTVTYKVLGQSAPAATTPTDLYTPSGVAAVGSTLAICNRGVTTTFRVSVRPAGAVQDNKHYIIYDQVINQQDSIFLTLGITLATTDVVTIYAGTANLSFTLFGSENS